MPRICGLIFCLICLMLPARAESPGDIANPRVNKRSWVADNAGVVDGATEKRINDLLTPLYRKTGAQVAVATVNSLDGMSLEDFANDLFKRWKIGGKKTDGGVLLLVAVKDRKMRIETGYEMEATLTDAQAKSITSGIIKPAFKRGDYNGGIYGGVYAIARRIDPSLPTTAPVQPPAQPPVASSDSPFKSPPSGAQPTPLQTAPPANSPLYALVGLLMIVLPIVGVVLLLRFLFKARPPRCPRCRTKMQLVPEAQEDAFLTDAQQFEESLGGRDWNVWRCPNDGFVDIGARDRWARGIADCPACSNHTVTSNTQTLVWASEFQQGLEATTHICQWPQCGHRWTTQRSIPRVMPVVIVPSSHSSSGGFGSSSSSDSGGSSYDSGPSDFGGGDSGGGGASDSW